MLREDIIEHLLPGPQLMGALTEALSLNKKVTVQAVYKVLRQLRMEEVIIVHKHHVSLSHVWLLKEQEKFQFASDAYAHAPLIERLQKGEVTKASFSFKTLNEIDLFWTYTYIQIGEHVPSHIPTYSIQPHDWYYYARLDTDAYWVKKHTESGRLSRTLLTHSTELDRLVTRERKKKVGELFQYTLGENPLGQSNDRYYNLLGEYIFTVTLDPHIAEKLEALIESEKRIPLSAKGLVTMSEIGIQKGIFKYTIERSSNRAKEMERKIKKYFEF